MPHKTAKSIARHFTSAEIEVFLRLVALNGGGIEKARQVMKPSRFKVPSRTLGAKWVDEQFNDRYQEIRAELQPEIQRKAAEEAMQLAMRAEQGVGQFVDKAVEKIDEVPARDLAPSARALSQVHAENIEKSLLLKNQPTQIIQHEGLDELVAQLKAEIEGEPQRIDDAEVVEEDEEE